MPISPTTEPCPNRKHTGEVARIEWGDVLHVIYYRCAGCGHVWAADRDGKPLLHPPE
jgi:DNA-directed RNA polymerase subunit M/transcription elongation factor TFIIS